MARNTATFFARATKVIAAQVAESMVSAVRIERMGPAAFNPVTGKHAPVVAALIYVGKAHVAGLAGPVSYAIGDEVQLYSSATISIPIAAVGTPLLVRVHDRVTITAHGDPAAIGRTYDVIDVGIGGLIPAVTRLSVIGAQPAPNVTL